MTKQCIQSRSVLRVKIDVGKVFHKNKKECIKEFIVDCGGTRDME